MFFNVLFAEWVDPASAQEYIAGMILLGVAPCTAMVFVWSQLTKGDPNYTLVQVSVNDVIMIFAFAPISAFLLGVSDIQVPWQTLLVSVLLYVLLPLIAGVLTWQWLNKRRGEQGINQFLAKLKPWSVIGLLATVVLLFGFPDSPFAQPKNVFFGHLLTAFVGIIFVKFCETGNNIVPPTSKKIATIKIRYVLITV